MCVVFTQGVLRFWLDRGIDGFRVNNVAFLFENSDLRNETFLNDTCTFGSPVS